MKNKETSVQNTANDLNVNFSANEKKRLQTLTSFISQCAIKESSAALAKAGALLEIKEKKLFLIHYPNFATYCVQEHGISAGNSADAVNVMARFREPGTYKLGEKYKDVNYGKLRAMRDMTDEEIDRLRLIECPTAESVKNTIKEYKSIKSELPPNWTFEDAQSAVQSKHQRDDSKKIEQKVAEIDREIADVSETNTEMGDMGAAEVATENTATISIHDMTLDDLLKAVSGYYKAVAEEGLVLTIRE